MNQISWDVRNATRHLTEACMMVAGVWAFSSTMAIACVEDIKGEAVTIEQAAQSTSPGAETSMDRLGAGWFQAAEIVKEGGSTDETYVTLALDGQEMITTSFASLENPWMQLSTPYMTANVRAEGNTRRMIIWYTSELRFMFLVSLHVDVHEEGVDSVRMRAVMNKAIHIAPLPGMPTANVALPSLPAFK
jgi:hypothetical protein